MNPVEIGVGVAEILPAEVFLDVSAIFPAFRETEFNGLLDGFAPEKVDSASKVRVPVSSSISLGTPRREAETGR